jgi:hypothetical protein
MPARVGDIIAAPGARFPPELPVLARRLGGYYQLTPIPMKVRHIISTLFALSLSATAIAQTEPPGFVQVVPD